MENSQGYLDYVTLTRSNTNLNSSSRSYAFDCTCLLIETLAISKNAFQPTVPSYLSNQINLFAIFGNSWKMILIVKIYFSKIIMLPMNHKEVPELNFWRVKCSICEQSTINI